MKFLDLFAGVGGFRRGLELAGHECVGFCEWDKFAAASYTSMHLITDEQRSRLATMDLKKRQKEILKEEYRNGEWYSADVRLITADNIPRADCWCFGAPCQDFSVAGLRKGLDGDRSSLVREVFRVLGELKEEDRPEWLIYENVKGMLSSNRGADFGAIILEMGELGYDIEWELFNSKNFGVPQNRERVYTIGHLRSRGRHQILPLKGANREDSVSVEIIGHRNGYRRNTQVFAPEGATEALSTCQGGGREHHTIVPVMFGIDKNVQGSETEGVNFRDLGGVAIPVLTPDRAEKRQNGRRFKDNGEDMFTLTSQDKHGVAIGLEAIGGVYTQDSPDYHRGVMPDTARCLKANTHDSGVMLQIREAVSKGYTEAHEGDSINLTMPESKTRRGRVGKKQAQTLDCGCNQGIIVKLNDNDTVYAVWYEKYQCYIAIRKLTPRECFRLQGWTDDYFEKAAFVNSDSQLYKQAGNGVTVNVVQAIGEAIKED
jgi:DNA (cytosine-5)-methyltransferase 1